jgi:dolichol-phosphate mannosyltransferase
VGVSVVVPTYNERERLEELIERIFDAWQRSREAELAGSLEVVVVDDNSPDGTGECADAIARRRSVRVVHRAGKLGLGTAVIAGFEVARGRVVAVMDADLSHPPQLLPRLVGVLRETGADFVVASRYVSGGFNNDLLVRRVMSRAACRVAGRLTPVRDAMSGFFALHADRARSAHTEAKGFKICLELLVRSLPRTVAEVPYSFVGRSAGKSKMNLGEALLFVRQFWSLRTFNARRESTWPAHIVADATATDEATEPGELIMPASRSR